MAGISSTNGIQQVAWLCLVLVLSQGTVHAGALGSSLFVHVYPVLIGWDFLRLAAASIIE